MGNLKLIYTCTLILNERDKKKGLLLRSFMDIHIFISKLTV